MRLENMLKVGIAFGFLGAIGAGFIGCSKSDKFYKEYKQKQTTSDTFEKEAVSTITRYFGSSQKNDFDEYWGCLSAERKNSLSSNTIFNSDDGENLKMYEVAWSKWISAEPKLEKINSVSMQGAEARVNVDFSCKEPAGGVVLRYSGGNYYLIKENSKWKIKDGYVYDASKQEIGTFQAYEIRLMKIRNSVD